MALQSLLADMPSWWLLQASIFDGEMVTLGKVKGHHLDKFITTCGLTLQMMIKGIILSIMNQQCALTNLPDSLHMVI